MYFVSGAAGHLGQSVLNHLLDTLKVPASKIVAGSRDPEKLAAYSRKGVSVRKADFDDEDGLVRALAGVTRFLLISTDANDTPSRRGEQHARAVKAAARAGVGHIVYTSAPRVENSPMGIAPSHLSTEKAIAASGIRGWSILRNNWYFENLFFTYPSALASGSLYTAAGQGKIAHIARGDLGRAAAVALASDFEGKRTLTLGGAKAYTTDEIAALVATATGKPLKVVHVSVDALVQGMIHAGLPEPVAKLFASFDAGIAQGGLSDVNGDYKALTGVEPTSFASWLDATAPALVQTKAA